MTADGTHAWSTAIATVLAAAVAFVEALAVGAARGWRSTLTGTSAVFAAATQGWIALVWVRAALATQPGPWVAILLFGGLAAILLESALRRSGAAR
ncbi:hypothetical protein MKK75_23660 [Methylobacterium sp. J-030]|uniref:hypothetical protein n=1 Tax=Methylobacterium sp. J-030 TaxID=2836627 RepID=UPI001FBB497E|nr:hypothetical protein [Methylobacterium sp. J-030]MCJ2071760.1 hypothetical protein [Methylobacterium sp. J-030]